MRAEILKLMDEHRKNPDVTQATTFQFDALEGELQISGVFVRVYIAQPTYQLSDPFEFAKGMVKFIHSTVVAGRQASFKAKAEDEKDESNAALWSHNLSQLQRQHLYQTLVALQLLFESVPKLLGLMASPSALAPILACLDPACLRGHKEEHGGFPGEFLGWMLQLGPRLVDMILFASLFSDGMYRIFHSI